MATKKKTEADSKGKLKFSSPLDMLEHEAEKSPKETGMDLGVKIMKLASESGTTEAEYQQEPGFPVDDWREGFEREYGWLAPNNVAGVYRAILQELYRLRIGK